MTDAQRQQLASRFADRGGFGSMVGRLLLRGRGQAGAGAGAPPATSAKSRSDMFTRARRVRTGAKGQTTTPTLAPTSDGGGY
jgi:hypothetical protein